MYNQSGFFSGSSEVPVFWSEYLVVSGFQYLVNEYHSLLSYLHSPVKKNKDV